MTIKDDVDQAIDGYHGDDLQIVTVGFAHWDAFCEEVELTPTPVIGGSGDVEVLYLGISVRPGISPDKITLVTGS